MSPQSPKKKRKEKTEIICLQNWNPEKRVPVPAPSWLPMKKSMATMTNERKRKKDEMLKLKKNSRKKRKVDADRPRIRRRSVERIGEISLLLLLLSSLLLLLLLSSFCILLAKKLARFRGATPAVVPSRKFNDLDERISVQAGKSKPFPAPTPSRGH